MPLILTLGFDAHSFARLEPLRQRHFPAGRNYIPAHVTLFQQLPGDQIARLRADLAHEAMRTPPLAFTAAGILDFGGGTAVDLSCDAARALQARLRHAWSDILTRSDDQIRRLHVTVQNKVDRKTAQATQDVLRAGYIPWEGLFDHLFLWHYRGGPWERAGTFPLTGDHA